ncbi:(2Fe-2S)-binding protein [Streptomyces sp. NPDC090052]|uniref:(2Fe-2S)-binding protein n=1 Tax=Streptomyces sp. NPDC090052 TaxID=3365931 RepID=UPI003816D02C
MTYRMTFRGTGVPAEPGQSVAAALVAAGITDWRTTRKDGRPRGLFCGIGVCFDCLITVDGARAERACLVPAADGMRLGDALESGDVAESGGVLAGAGDAESGDALDGEGDPESGDAQDTRDDSRAAQHAEEDGDGAHS